MKNENINLELSYAELLQINMALVARIGIIQAIWASGVKDQEQNKFYLSLMNTLAVLSSKIDEELKKHNQEAEEQ